MKKATTFLVAFLLSLCASVSTALVTPLGGTLSLVECADGKMWSVCAPGNEIGPPPPSGIIFETDFSEDAAFSSVGVQDWTTIQANAPTGWDGAKTGGGRIDGAAGEGVGGSVAMKITYNQASTNLAVSLLKHLTGDHSTGYDDLYIRYKIRLPNDTRIGRDNTALAYWKLGRLWQNTGTEEPPLAGGGWTEQRVDSYYTVMKFGSGLPRWGIEAEMTFAENLNQTTSGSTGSSPRATVDWYQSGSDAQGYHTTFDGHWDAIGGGALEFDHTTRYLLDNTNQTWHTIEWRFKLSSTDTSNDGIWQLWFDGVEQISPNVIGGIDQPVDSPHTNNSMITAAKPGFNFFTFMDNLSGFANDQPFVVYVNDVVVSTERIGHTYVAGSVQ